MGGSLVSFHKCRHNLSLTPMPKHVVRTLLVSSIRVSTLCPAAAPQRLPLKRVFMHSPPTILAWIADYRHGTRRFSLLAGKRMRCELLREPWFVNRLAQHGALPQLDSSDLWPARVVIRGLVSVAKGECWTTLAPTSCEAELLWRYFGRPLDLFTLQVQRRWALTAPAEAHVQQRGSYLGSHSIGVGDTVALHIGSRGFFFNPVTLTSADRMLLGGVGVQPVWSVLQQCGVLEDHIDNIPTMLLPQPIATLLFAGAWSDLVCLARWRLRFWPEWPPQAWIQEVHHQHWRPRDAQTLSAADIRSIAKDLRRWAPLIAGPSIASQEGYNHRTMKATIAHII